MRRQTSDVEVGEVAHARIDYLKRALRSVREVHQLALRERDLPRLVQQACDVLVETCGYPSVWIALDQGDANDAASCGGAAGRAAACGAFLAKLREGWRPPCRDLAVAAQHSVVLLDPETACAGCPLTEECGCTLATCTALRHEGEVFGVLAAASSTTSFSLEDQSLLEEVAGDLAFAIRNIRSETARRQHEELFRASFEGAPIGQALTSLDGRFIRVNVALASMLGCAPEDLVGKTFNDVTYAEDREVGLAAMQALLAGQGETRFQKRYVRSDGTLIWVEVCVAVVHAADGKPSCFIASMLDISQAKRAQQEIEDLSRFPHENPAPVLRVSSDGTLLYANSVAGPLLETWHTAKGMRVPEELGQAIREALRTERSVSFDQPIDGRCYEMVAVPVANRGYVNLYGHDVAERRKAEAALLAEKAFAESLVNTAQTIILVLDPQGCVVTYNPYMEALSGVSAAEARGKDWFETFLPERKRAQTRALFKTALGNISTHGNVDVLVTRDGRELLIEWYDKTLKDSSGKVIGLLSIGHDVTARQHAEAELRFQRMLLESQNEASLDGILVVDADGKMIWHNRMFSRLWRIPEHVLASRSDEAALGSVLEQLVDPDTFLTRVRELYGQRTTKSRDVIELKDGRVFDRYSSPVTSKGGTYLGRVWLFRDITERKQAEKEREQLQASLAQSDRLASTGMVAASVAHEINNPLTYVLFNIESVYQDLPKLAQAMDRCWTALTAHLGIAGATSALGDDAQSLAPGACNDAVDRLKNALSGARRIERIVRSLGTFSRVERTELEPVNLQSCIEHAATMGWNEVRFRARFVKDFAPVPPVLASEGKLAQVFLNLIVNASHAIPEGHIEENEVRARTWVDGDFVVAEVSDTGRGIAPEHQDKVFEPFFTTKGIGVGTGLGLSICKKIINDFGGDVSFTSELGKGTKFVIRLPRVPGDWAGSATDTPTPAPVQPAVRGRILVIDDEEGIRASIVRMLRKDHDVVAVQSGEEGRVLLEKDKGFDLIFCDLMMPKLSGMDLHAWLAQQDPRLADQVVFITGGTFTPGASDYLAKLDNLRVEKPFDVDAFERMTNELVIAARSKRGA